MQQYLINTTAIWLLSLVLFDVFLRKENYHSYNRAYLMLTLLLGTLLPLAQWPVEYGATLPYPKLVQQPLERLVTAGQAMGAAATPERQTNPGQWLLMIYITGVLVAICLIVIDILKLARLYRAGTRTTVDGSQIIETGCNHAPFSFRNLLFVSSRARYSDSEWQMILNHEQLHHRLLHIADLILVHIIRIMFWFHPLVYIYNHRLLLVHEYQADSNAGKQQAVYGKFLIEQALLSAGPVMASSFNSSSIKRRLKMLTHKSHGKSKLKMLVFLPLLAVSICCFTKNGLANKPNKEGNVCKWRGNTIEFLAPKKPDSYLHKDEATGTTSRRPISWPTPPIKLNGKQIYDAERDQSVVPSTVLNKEKGLAAYILEHLRGDFEKLADGNYFIIVSDIVIDENGKIVYFQNEGIFKTGGSEEMTDRLMLNDKIDELLANAPVYEPAKLNNTPVPFFHRSLFAGTFGYGPEADFTIKDHKLTLGNTTR